MVDRAYLEGHRAPPNTIKRFLDQAVIPAAIDAAGGVEAGVERVAGLVRRYPLPGLGVAMLVGMVATRLALQATAARRPPARWV